MVEERFRETLGQDTRVKDYTGDDIGVNVRGRSSVLNVSLTVVSAGSGRNTEGGRPVANTV